MWQNQDSTQRFLIPIHGNNGFKSNQLLDQLGINTKRPSLESGNGIKELLPFSDLNLFKMYSPVQPCTEMTIEQSEQSAYPSISAILVLVSLTEIFSASMSKLISQLPNNEFYHGFNEGNDKKWWKHVIVVFSVEDNEGGDDIVRKSIEGNSGIREIVQKAENRYISVSNSTTTEKFTEKLDKLLFQLNQWKLDIEIDSTESPSSTPLPEKLLRLFAMLFVVTAALLISIILLFSLLPFTLCILPWILAILMISIIIRKHRVKPC